MFEFVSRSRRTQACHEGALTRDTPVDRSASVRRSTRRANNAARPHFYGGEQLAQDLEHVVPGEDVIEQSVRQGWRRGEADRPTWGVVARRARHASAPMLSRRASPGLLNIMKKCVNLAGVQLPPLLEEAQVLV
jgi:hypothetical protein